jgi:hypothetical protein
MIYSTMAGRNLGRPWSEEEGGEALVPLFLTDALLKIYY